MSNRTLRTKYRIMKHRIKVRVGLFLRKLLRREKRGLYRIWVSWADCGSGNRDELLRVFARDEEDAIEYAKIFLIDPKIFSELDSIDVGYSWSEADFPEDDPEGKNVPEDDRHMYYTTYCVYYEEIESSASLWNKLRNKYFTEDELSLNLLGAMLQSIDRFRNITEFPSVCIECHYRDDPCDKTPQANDDCDNLYTEEMWYAEDN